MNNISIRSITYSIDLNLIAKQEYQQNSKQNIEQIKTTFANNNIFVRTVRLNILPITQNERLDKFLFLKKIKILSDFSKSINIRWFNISFDLTELDKKNIQVINSISYDILKKFPNAFVNFIVADNNRINPFAAKQCAETILNISKLSNNGYDNFRLGVSLKPNPNTPFFPFSYSTKDNSFSLAIETTQFFLNVLKQNKEKSLIEKRDLLINEISPIILNIENLANSNINDKSFSYGGMDISLSPYPNENISVIEILTELGLDDIGSKGTLFYTGFITEIIKKIIKKTNIKPTGFNGVMYSLLEDNLMCEANNKKLISIDQIMSYSTLCGCGLDMIPISGNILIEELASMIMDIGMIALKLNKPLGVRVLPIPNKEENEFTSFDMDFLTNTRVMKLKNLSINTNIFDMLSISIN